MTSSSSSWWRWPLLVILLGGIVALVVYYFLVVPLDGNPVEYGVNAAFSLSGLVWAIPGVVVLVRSRWHIVGWLLVGLGLLFAFPDATAAWNPASAAFPWATWVSSWLYHVGFTLMVVLLTLFPDGLAARSRRERAWGRVRITLPIVICATAMLEETVVSDTFGTTGPNPTGLGFVPQAVTSWLFGPLLVLLVVSAVSLWRRSRRADETVRRQYTWVLFPFGLMIGFVALALPLARLIGNIVWVGSLPLFLMIPIAFSIAMVRYHWFDIDRIVSRTVSYAAVALVIAVVYVIPAVVLAEVLGLSSDLAVALATLTAAAVFTPLRRRVQSTVARRFDRERFDAERVVAAFSGRLQTAVDLGVVAEELRGAVGVALRPSTVALWLSDPVPAQVT